MQIPTAKIENFVVPANDEHGSDIMKQIWLDVDGERLLATNGHMAARVTIGVTEDDISGLIPVEAFDLARKELKILTKALGKDTIPDPMLKVTAGADAVVIQNLLTNTTHIVNRKKLRENEKFPNMDPVFYPISKNPDVTLNADYVTAILKSLDGYGVSLWAPAEDKPVFMTSPGGKVAVVLMPMKADVQLPEINLRGAAVKKRKSKQPESGETTVRMGAVIDGKETWTEPMTSTDFTKACEQVGK